MSIAIILISPEILFLVPVSIVLLFGLGEKEDKIKNIPWSVPIPPDLLARLRDFSPLSISRTSGIYLDDVFDILNGTKERTAPEVIEKLIGTIEKLQNRDKQLDKEAAKMAYLIRGFEALEQKEKEKPKGTLSLPERIRKT